MATKTRRRQGSVVAEPPPSYSPRRILLDTHVWLWWQGRDRRLGRGARALITHSEDVRFSAASAWEIAIKRGTGKLDIPADADVARELERAGFIALSVSIAHTEAVRHLPALHADPFDRMLIAQAQVEGLTIVTADEVMRRYSVAVIDARE